MHIISLEFTDSRSRLTVVNHEIFPIQLPPVLRANNMYTPRWLVAKSQRGLWYHPIQDTSTLELEFPKIDFNDPSRMGSIRIQKDLKFSTIEFDEVSVRLLLVSSTTSISDQWVFYLGKVMD